MRQRKDKDTCRWADALFVYFIFIAVHVTCLNIGLKQKAPGVYIAHNKIVYDGWGTCDISRQVQFVSSHLSYAAHTEERGLVQQLYRASQAPIGSTWSAGQYVAVLSLASRRYCRARKIGILLPGKGARLKYAHTASSGTWASVLSRCHSHWW